MGYVNELALDGDLETGTEVGYDDPDGDDDGDETEGEGDEGGYEGDEGGEDGDESAESNEDEEENSDPDDNAGVEEANDGTEKPQQDDKGDKKGDDKGGNLKNPIDDVDKIDDFWGYLQKNWSKIPKDLQKNLNQAIGEIKKALHTATGSVSTWIWDGLKGIDFALNKIPNVNDDCNFILNDGLTTALLKGAVNTAFKTVKPLMVLFKSVVKAVGKVGSAIKATDRVGATMDKIGKGVEKKFNK
jgi:hypothetical protein